MLFRIVQFLVPINNNHSRQKRRGCRHTHALRIKNKAPFLVSPWIWCNDSRWWVAGGSAVYTHIYKYIGRPGAAIIHPLRYVNHERDNRIHWSRAQTVKLYSMFYRTQYTYACCSHIAIIPSISCLAIWYEDGGGDDHDDENIAAHA